MAKAPPQRHTAFRIPLRDPRVGRRTSAFDAHVEGIDAILKVHGSAAGIRLAPVDGRQDVHEYRPQVLREAKGSEPERKDNGHQKEQIMSVTIEQVLAARKTKDAAARTKTSPLTGHLADIVALLNGGALWVDILEYLEAKGVRTSVGTPVARSPLIDWCTVNVPAYDEAVGTTEAEKGGRRVALTGANKYTRQRAAKRAAVANGSLAPASVAPAAAVAVAQTPSARLIRPLADLDPALPSKGERMAEQIARATASRAKRADEEKAVQDGKLAEANAKRGASSN